MRRLLETELESGGTYFDWSFACLKCTGSPLNENDPPQQPEVVLCTAQHLNPKPYMLSPRSKQTLNASPVPGGRMGLALATWTGRC